LGSGFRVQGSGFKVQGSGFRVQVPGFKIQDLRIRVEGYRCQVQVSESLGMKVHLEAEDERHVVPRGPAHDGVRYGTHPVVVAPSLYVSLLHRFKL
jgi:hypothetical protein